MTNASPAPPVLILAPHASERLPDEILDAMLAGRADAPEARAAQRARLFCQGDPFTDEIFRVPDAPLVAARVSRFVVDLNRYRDDTSANGVVREVDFDGRPLYPAGHRIRPEERARRLARYWDGYHAEIETALAEHDIRMIVSGHSMSPVGPAVGPDAGRPRPALTLMTGGDERGEPAPGCRTSLEPDLARRFARLLAERFADLIEAAGMGDGVALNRPWSFDELPQTYSDPRRPRPLPAFGLEVNRRLYLRDTEAGCEPIPGRIEALNRRFRAFLAAAVPHLAKGAPS